MTLSARKLFLCASAVSAAVAAAPAGLRIFQHQLAIAYKQAEVLGKCIGFRIHEYGHAADFHPIQLFLFSSQHQHNRSAMAGFSLFNGQNRARVLIQGFSELLLRFFCDFQSVSPFSLPNGS